ncbi:hypothetical protein JOF41_005494 [Saccharothrix coeruleofusca]|uniref:DUF3558 family protein n=1 Tax=Saccharothrix coeruleofusca TaxID=33919 RepID=UPI001AE614EC|nr:DUF3558 family protein [Saccharothrix coeruleofusca]MBP2339316.1 hypothetical protein [Saccharothrix coeruleofusca]
MIKSIVARTAALLTFAGLVLASCGSGEHGNPSPASTTTAVSAADAPESASTSPAGGASLVGFEPCSVFTSITAQFGLTGIKEDGSASCLAVYSDGVTARLDVRPSRGLDDFVPGANSEISETSVGSRQAKLVKKPVTSTSCAVAIEVSVTSRVDVFATSDTSLDESCKAATDIAAAVEPELPE